MSSLEERFQKEEEEVADLAARVRDLSLYYKELKTRHGIQFDSIEKDRTHKLVYGAQVNSIFASPPEVQRKFRADFIDKLAEVPTPEPVVMYPDLLHQEFLQAVEVCNEPSIVRRQLHEFFTHRASDLQQLKFKLLLQWAHFCRTAETLELSWAELWPRLNLIQAELDACVARLERLMQDDDFGNTKTKPVALTEDGNLLFERVGDTFFSSIARDDIEVALKVKSSSWRSERYLRRFLHHCQWLHVTQKQMIWKRSKEHLVALRAESIERMKKMTGQDNIGREDVQGTIVVNTNLKNIKRQLRMMQKVKAFHSTFAEKHFNRNEQLLSSHKDTVDAPPVVITSLKQLQYVLELEALKNDIRISLDLDDGQSLAYHVTHMFPESFEMQKQKIVLVAYDASPQERDMPAVRYSNLRDIKAPRVGDVKRATMISQSAESKASKTSNVAQRSIAKIVRLKRSDWVECVVLTPRENNQSKLQAVRFAHMTTTDALLASFFNAADVQDLPNMNRALETFTQEYLERASKRKALLTEAHISEKLLKRRYFTTLLNDRMSDVESGVEDKLDLPLHCIKALYTLVLIGARDHKQRIVEYCNAFRSVQRRLAMDVMDLGVRDQATPEKELIPPNERTEDPTRVSSIEGLGMHFEKSFVNWACPILPTQHTLFAKACTYRLESVHSLANRRDAIEVLEDGVYVKDEFGVYICYDAAFKDYELLKAELIKLGSHFIYSYESLLDEQGEAAIDRCKLSEELLGHEADFQKAKLELVLIYVEVYEHAIQKDRQFELAQIIVDLMALRPSFNFEASYFVQAYSLAKKILQAHTRLLRSIVDFQASYEVDVQSRNIDADLSEVTNSSNFVVQTTSHSNSKLFQVFPAITKVTEIWPSLQGCLEELELIFTPENTTVLGSLELSLWESALSEWQESLQPALSRLEDGNLLDNPQVACRLVHELSHELNGSDMPRLVPRGVPVVKAGKVEVEKPTELRLYCNLWEAFKLKQQLVAQAEQALMMQKHYDLQMSVMKVRLTESEPPRWEADQRQHVPSVDDGPGSTIDLSLPVFELDPRLRANFNFSSPEAVKNLMLPAGLEDLRAAVSYQVMQKQLMQIGLQINSCALFPWDHQLAEIKLARSHSYISKKTDVQWVNVLGKKGEGFVENLAQVEESRLASRRVTSAARFCFNIQQKKVGEVLKAVKAYQRFCAKLAPIENSEVYAAVVRRARAQAVQAYCSEVLRAAYYDSIKLQIIKVSNEFSRETSVLPDEDNVFSRPVIGREGVESPINYVNESRQIMNAFYIPADEEVLRIPSLNDDERARWRNWDPYAILDFQATREHPPLQTSPTDQMTRLSSFSYDGCLKSVLDLLVGQLRHFQLKLFLNQLSSPVLEQLELKSSVSNQEQFWTVTEEPAESLQEQLVVNMLSEASSQALLIEDIKRAMNSMRLFKQTLNDKAALRQVLLDKAVAVAFGTLSEMLFGLLHYCLLRDNEYGASQVFIMLSKISRINAGKVFLHGRPFASLNCNPQNETLELLRSTLQVTAQKPTHSRVDGARLKELAWGLMNISAQDRNYATALTTGCQISLDNYIAGRQVMRATHPVEALDAQLYYIGLELRLARLKLAFFTVQNHGLVLEPSKYEHSMNLYRDRVEWKVDYMANRQRLELAEREAGRLEAEASILRTELQRLFCTFAVQFLEQQTANIVKSAETPLDFTAVEDFSCNPDRNYTDITRKVGTLHAFLNAVRNRSSQVITPTSGAALVISITDLTNLS
jgi:hypothetical protein